MPDDARQNATNATAASARTPLLATTPAAKGAASTSTFFTHCRGRAARTRPPTTSTRCRIGPPVRAGGVEVAVIAGCRP